MATLIARRLGMLALMVFGVTLVTFVISRIIPGDPLLLIAGPRATPETLAALRASMNLDGPLYAQYLSYLADLIRGDFGVSLMTRQPVLDELMSYMPATAELMILALLISVAVGVPLGVLTAAYKDSTFDSVVRGIAITGISTPTFWLGLLLILLLYGSLDFAPAGGRIAPDLIPPERVTGFFLIDSLLAGDFAAFSSALAHLALPALTLAFASIGTVLRLIRSSMIDVLKEDYIRTMLAYGMPYRRVIFRYGLRNALMPFVTVLGLELATLLFGSVIVESVFAWPGIGNFVLEGILNLDFPVIMGFVVLASIVYVLANLLVDLFYLVLDPRIRASS